MIGVSLKAIEVMRAASVALGLAIGSANASTFILPDGNDGVSASRSR